MFPSTRSALRNRKPLTRYFGCGVDRVDAIDSDELAVGDAIAVLEVVVADAVAGAPRPTAVAIATAVGQRLQALARGRSRPHLWESTASAASRGEGVAP